MKHKKIFRFHSIRHRIMLIFMGLMAAMLLAIWGVNTWWLEGYYVDQKLKVMEQAYTDIDNAIQEKVGENENIGDVLREELEQEWDIWKQTAKGDTGSDSEEEPSGTDETEPSDQADEAVPKNLPEDLPPEQGTLLGTIRTYSEQNNIAITLIDSDTGKALVSSGRDSDFLTQKLQRYVLGMGHKHMEILKQHDNYVVEKNRDFRSSSTYIESWGYFSDNRTMFIMSMPLASIRESVALSNRFTTWVGLIVLVFGSIMMCFVTNRITKPIMKLSALSEEMSKLNFDVSYEDDAEDEVGVLGRSMNSLSHSLKDAIGALQDANKQLQHDIDEKIQIDEMRKEFIANVSHDFRSPLTSIKGYLEAILDGTIPPEMYEKYLSRVISETERLHKLTESMLTLNSLDAKGFLSRTNFDINRVIKDTAASFEGTCDSRHIRFDLTFSDNIQMVYADMGKIQQVLYNLIDNAIKFSHDDSVIYIQASSKYEKIFISVKDTGIGIPRDSIKKIWDRFYKTDLSRGKDKRGTGLGLSIVKEIIQAHGENIDVISTEGVGTEFIFSLPGSTSL